MSCRSVLPLLPLLVEGDLTAAEASAAREHLAACPACRGREAALRESQAWLRDAAAAAPAPFDAKELAAIRASVLERIERRPRSFRLEWLGVTAALAAALVLAILPGRIPSTPPDASPIPRASLRPAPAPAPPAPPLLVAARAEPRPARSAPRRRTDRTAPAAVAPREPAIASGLPVTPDLRLELETPNPNVRIIWFVPSTPS